MSKKSYRYAELAFQSMGAMLQLIVLAALLHRWLAGPLALAEFDKGRAAYLQANLKAGRQAPADDGVDFRLWSEKRIRDYRASLLLEDAPLAVLRIQKLKIRVPVFEGASELALNRGVGWIPGTAKPGDTGNGNVGLAGHRDSFFRKLKELRRGDGIEVSTLGAVSTYSVDRTEIVAPENVGVLRPRGAPSLTLVTCYPFYFIGAAPRRFIVHATLKQRVDQQ